jgi:Lon protease-like protein
LPLNIFEPRYVAMIDDAIAGERIIGMIQPLQGQDERGPLPPLYKIGCAGRITRFSETGDGRYLISLTGVARFRVEEELEPRSGYRRCRVDYSEFERDLEAGAGEDEVDRSGMIRMLRNFAECAKMEVDWTSIDAAPNEALVNALAMMSPFGADAKQALLEASDLRSRADMLVALAELDLAQDGNDRPQFH